MALWFVFNEDISPMIFHSKPCGKRVFMSRSVFFPWDKRFFFKHSTLHIYKLNSFSDLKQKRLLDNESWEPLDRAVSCMEQLL